MVAQFPLILDSLFFFRASLLFHIICSVFVQSFLLEAPTHLYKRHTLGYENLCPDRIAEVFCLFYVQYAHVAYKQIDATYLLIRKLTYRSFFPLRKKVLSGFCVAGKIEYTRNLSLSERVPR